MKCAAYQWMSAIEALTGQCPLVLSHVNLLIEIKLCSYTDGKIAVGLYNR